MPNIYSLLMMRKLFFTESEARFDGFSLYIGNTSDISSNELCYRDKVDGKSPSVFQKACNTKGRYVIVYNTKIADGNIPRLILCEVEIYGMYFISFLGRGGS